MKIKEDKQTNKQTKRIKIKSSINTNKKRKKIKSNHLLTRPKMGLKISLMGKKKDRIIGTSVHLRWCPDEKTPLHPPYLLQPHEYHVLVHVICTLHRL